MNKKQIIEKIMEEYSQYGLNRIEVEISYLLAILWRVPKDSIYHGMRMIFNNVYGISGYTPAFRHGYYGRYGKYGKYSKYGKYGYGYGRRKESTGEENA